MKNITENMFDFEILPKELTSPFWNQNLHLDCFQAILEDPNQNSDEHVPEFSLC